MSPTTYGEVLARNIRAARSRAGLSQQDLAERMQQLGYSAWLYQTVGNVERGKRRVTAEEILALALALDTTIAALMGASDQDGTIDLPGGQRVGAISVERSAGRGVNDRSVTWRGTHAAVTVLRRPSDFNWIDSEGHSVSAEAKWDPDHETQLQPVVAAIVTSRRGVLVGRRKDGMPQWTFIAGEQEPGEQPADTIIREVKEEAGLDIRPGEVIGERDHPATGRHMIYMAATPVHRTAVIVGDEAELAEVRWVTFAEAGKLLTGMFGAVREHLAAALVPKGGAR